MEVRAGSGEKGGEKRKGKEGGAVAKRRASRARPCGFAHSPLKKVAAKERTAVAEHGVEELRGAELAAFLDGVAYDSSPCVHEAGDRPRRLVVRGLNGDDRAQGRDALEDLVVAQHLVWSKCVQRHEERVAHVLWLFVGAGVALYEGPRRACGGGHPPGTAVAELALLMRAVPHYVWAFCRHFC